MTGQHGGHRHEHRHEHGHKHGSHHEHTAPKPRTTGSRAGLVLYHGIETGAELARYGRIAERAGFESLWVTERAFHEETFAQLGYLAAATERIGLGVAVVNAYTRHPALLAMAAATLDRTSGGRFTLGLGASERSTIEGRLGIPYDQPHARLRETVEILRCLFAGKSAPATSRFKLTNAQLAVLPLQSRLPVYLAAIGPKALRLAGAIADGVILNTYVPTGYVRWAVSEVRRGAQEAGRDPSSVEIACMLSVRMIDDPARVRESQRERIVRLLCEPHTGELILEHGSFDPAVLPPLRVAAQREGARAAARYVTDAMVEGLFVVGPAERCRQRIQEYRHAGVTLPLLLPRLDDYEAVANTLQA